MKAIVYTTNTGSSKTYAEMLGTKTGLPVLPYEDAKSALTPTDEIIYIGWLMAGAVVNLEKAQKRFSVRAVLAVGMTASDEMRENVRRRNHLSDDMPLFLAQGAYDKNKLHGMYRFAMKLVGKMLEKKISAIPARSAEEERILKMLREGGSGISDAYLAEITAWYEGQKA